MRSKLELVILSLLLPVVAGGCSRPQQARFFYTLTYPMPRPSFQTPHPYTVRVKDLSISSTYGSNQLVFRRDLHEVQYFQTKRWTNKPQKTISDLIRKNLSHIRLFQQVTENLGENPPDFVLTGEIEAIEQLDTGTQSYAHLAMSVRLVRFSNDKVVWRYSFDRRRPVPGDKVRSVVRALSQILESEMIHIVEGMAQYFAGLDAAAPAATPAAAPAAAPAGGAPPGAADGAAREGPTVQPTRWPATAPPPAPRAGEAASAPPPQDAAIRFADELAEPLDVRAGTMAEEEQEGPPAPQVIGPDPRSELNHHPQLLADDADMPARRGAIFLPALSEPDREPTLAVSRRGELVADGPMGRRIVVRPGEYDVRFGSGTGEQQLAVRVRVEEGRDTPVPPSWAALEVRVVNDRFIPFRGSYEIIHVPTRQEYGLGFGADEERGEELRVWVLPPGLYKIIQAGGTYRDRTNFATVLLEPGALTRFTLVQDEETGDFRGAGVLDPGEAVDDRTRAWKLTALVGGDVVFNQRDEQSDEGHNLTFAEQGWNLDFNLFFDGMLRYRNAPHQWLTRLEVEEGQTRTAGTDRFDNRIDRLYGHTLYTFDLVSWFGPYARIGIESNLLPWYHYPDEEQQTTIRELSGKERLTTAERIVLRGSFSPVQLMEGAGGNFRLLQTRPCDLSLRLGVGARQSWARGMLNPASQRVLEEVDDSFQEGFESTLVGMLRLSRWVTLSTELEGFLPFDEQPATITWRNQASLRLVSFASLNYRFNYNRKPIRTAEEEKPLTIKEHFLQLRFSYNLF